LGEAEEEARIRTDDAVSRKAAKIGTAGPLFVLWRSAMLEAFPDSMVAPWPRGTVAQVKEFAALTGDPVSLMAFAVENWTQVVRDRFGWMTKNPPPRLPDVRFLMRHAPDFIEALQAHRDDDITGYEMDPAVRLRRLGIPEAKIARMVGGR